MLIGGVIGGATSRIITTSYMPVGLQPSPTGCNSVSMDRSKERKQAKLSGNKAKKGRSIIPDKDS